MNDHTLTLRALNALGIQSLLPHQEQMLQLASESRNIVMTSPTGTGKTLAFTLNVIRSMVSGAPGPQTMVIVPSRELALQVGEVMRRIGSPDYKVTTCYGGHPFAEEQRSLEAGTDIVVSTPGRMLDHITRSRIDPRAVRFLVLDEYDKSLELGFSEEMGRILRRLRSLRRIVLTSATKIEEWPEWLNPGNYISVSCSPTGDSDKLQPKIEVVEIPSYDKDKLAVLDNTLMELYPERTVVFVNHRESAERVATFLQKRGYSVSLYHGGLEQLDRENALEKFVNGSAPVLITTDLGARGLDIMDVANVIHYHMPVSGQAWTHRNGRTGRMGRKGTAYVIVSENDSVPEYVQSTRTWNPPMAPEVQKPSRPTVTTLWIGAGKKDKISRGDIVGFLTKVASVPSDAIGHIALRDHNALVAVSASLAGGVIAVSKENKLKGHKVRISVL